MSATVSTRERAALLETVAAFVEQEIAPRVTEYDLAETLPQDLLARMTELGLFGGVIPAALGGLGLDYVTFAELVTEVSKVCQIMGTLVSMPSGLVGAGIERYGSDAQKARWLVPLARGEIFGAAAVTEPGSGSDVAGMTTSYERVGHDYVLRGSKAWISNLDIAEFFLTFATSDRSLRHRGITAFLVPRDTPGLELHPYKDKLGFRPLCTGDVVLNDVVLTKNDIVGVEGRGFEVAMTAVERGRLGVAARSVGVVHACLADSVAYARERKAFGHSIAEFQLVQGKITDMAVSLETSRLLVRHCAEQLDEGRRARVLTSMAKMVASDAAFRSAADAVQIHGAYGVSSEYRVGRMYRDAKVLQIVEGSNDLHRALIGEITLGLRSDGEKPTLRALDDGGASAPVSA